MPTDSSTKQSKQPGKKKRKEPVWLVYVAALLSGIILLADAVAQTHLSKTSAKLGIALIYSVIALLIGTKRTSAYVAAGLIWAATILTFFV
ncbi:hypothetical protein GF377_07315 [candidate division GN15 bacterium]|nr:hypothetical protein [candidate division GN15 bacterium]